MKITVEEKRLTKSLDEKLDTMNSHQKLFFYAYAYGVFSAFLDYPRGVDKSERRMLFRLLEKEAERLLKE